MNLSFSSYIVVILLWWLTAAAAGAPKEIPLPPLAKWSAEDTKAAAATNHTQLQLTTNYKIGRAASPPIPAKSGELFTLQAELGTNFPPRLASYYRCWLSIECLAGDKVLETFSSSEIVGIQAPATLVAVTALVPAQATAIRAVVSAQNKFAKPVDNAVSVENLRLAKLSGGPGKNVLLGIATRLPIEAGQRQALLFARSDWPDGTALQIATTRGKAPLSVLISDRKADIPLQYSSDDTGTAVVSCRGLNDETSIEIADPLAAIVAIDRVTADGRLTPVRVQLRRDGIPLKGPYHTSAPGFFLAPPIRLELAPGTWQLHISRGPQFSAKSHELKLNPGDRKDLILSDLSRIADPRGEGWYAGDGDGDVYHGERIYKDVSANVAADIAQSVGLDWLGVGNWGEPKPKNWAEARELMQALSNDDFVFMWTDERPKSREGHACSIGVHRPLSDRLGWGWLGANRPMRNFEELQAIRASGAATFVNHPLRWWMKGERFNTNMYSSLPFDLCAAGLLDGVNINEHKDAVQLWSMLLDHGYRVAATAGADFGLDRPDGPIPGLARMYCYCPKGMSELSLAAAVRQGHTIVSTGPILLADIEGLPPGSTVATEAKHRVRVRAWARGDEADPLKQIELWSHGNPIAVHKVKERSDADEHVFDWQPKGQWDWVAVRATSRKGWAMTSAFYAQSKSWQAPQQPVECQVNISTTGLTKQQVADAVVEVWDGLPRAVTSQVLRESMLGEALEFKAPVSATLVIRDGEKQRKEISLYEATGVRERIERIAAGERQEKPLLEWETYAEILELCRTAKVEIAF